MNLTMLLNIVAAQGGNGQQSCGRSLRWSARVTDRQRPDRDAVAPSSAQRRTDAQERRTAAPPRSPTYDL